MKKKEKEGANASGNPDKARPTPPIPPKPPKPQSRQTGLKTESRAYMGIQLGDVEPILRAHLDLQEGVGVLVRGVIEDSPAGVEAARAADMAVVGLVAGGHARPSLADRLRQAGADRIFETVDALEGYLSTL